MAKKKNNNDLIEAITESDMLIEKYIYKGEGELLVDRPSTPLEIKKEEPVINIEILSNKDTFNKLILTKNPFVLKSNNVIIFDSQKDKILDISFQEDYFTIKGKTFVYGGLSFKNKK